MKYFGICLGVVLVLAAILYFLASLPMSKKAEIPAEDAAETAGDVVLLRQKISRVNENLVRLEDGIARMFPAGPVVLIDSAANQISLIRDSRIEIQDKCSSGTGLELSDNDGNRSWVFDTPRGYFRVRGKVTNPVWFRPDWAFIEEGKPIPKNQKDRALANVLGDYAISFGDGYFIHGTLYTRLLGSSVTHGCIRVDDETLKKIYNTVQVGTPIWIY